MIVLFLMHNAISLAYGFDLSFAWDANTESDLAGYYIYYKNGSSGSPYDGTGADEDNSPIQIPIASLSDPDNPEYTIHGLSGTGTFYFVATTYDVYDNESEYSNELEYLIAALITGTLSDNANESDVVTGGQTLIITPTGDTFVATLGEDNEITTALIAGIDSAQSEAAGWDAVVKANMVYTDVTRDSDTQVTITLGAEATYSITANETITVTIPATALTGGVEIVATPTFDIINEYGSGSTMTHQGITSSGVTWR